jgi:polyvinyl alcohol dehydrogenase (cytochrome)
MRTSRDPGTSLPRRPVDAHLARGRRVAICTSTVRPGVVAAALVLGLAACGGPATPAGPAAAGPAAAGSGGSGSGTALGQAASWPEYHGNAARTGVGRGVPRAGRLSVAWSRRLDGAVYGQPLIIGGTVIAATENDSVYALRRATGQVLWRTHLGTPVPLSSQPCGNISPLGITGTPVYDHANGLVYAVADTGGSRSVLAGLRLSTGQVAVSRTIPAPDGHPSFDQQRAALALEAGHVYVAFGGHFGDCGPYLGSVAAVPADGRGPILSYRVPTARQGGIWSPGGPVIGPGGTIYVSVGNGAATRPPFDGSDSVTALSPALHRTGLFAPATWAADNASDLDLSSMSPALLPGGRILAVGKRGTGYLLRAARLGGIGGQLAEGRICPAFGAAAVSGTVAYVPCEGGGMAAVTVANDQLRVLWRGPGSASGSPVVGGGAVWVADWDAGTLYELAQASGAVRQRVGLGSALPHFASPSLSGSLALVGTMSGVVAVAGA